MKSGKDWKFRTEVSPEPLRRPFSLHDQILTLGSCFAEQMGARLAENKFKVFVNPTGTVYNPIALHRLINNACEKTLPDRSRFVQRDRQYYSLDFHSSFFGSSEDDLYQKLLEWNQSIKGMVASANVFILTYGTSWVYKTDQSAEPVANCHKLPGKFFSKHLLSPEEIQWSFSNLHQAITTLNPKAQWILTVSPVRHLKDTLPLNAVAKSVLRVACHKLSELDNVCYFPAYEIMTDDLRDYRFYEADLIHPSETAVDYIWELFRDAALHKPDLEILDRWEKVRRGLQHRPFNPSGSDYKKFLQQLDQELMALSSVLDLSAEIRQIKNLLSELK